MNNPAQRHLEGWIQTYGERMARHRLNQNLSQADLAQRAGISLRTLTRLENGEPTQLESFLRVLRALGLDHGFDQVVPEVPESPIQQLERSGKTRRRASGRRKSTRTVDEPWTWDES